MEYPLPRPGDAMGGHPIQHQADHRPGANQEGDERRDDVADLRKQAKAAKTESERKELEWAADRTALAMRIDRETFKDLRDLYRATNRELRRLVKDGSTTVKAALIRGDEAQLLGILQAAGLDGFNADWQARLDEAGTLARQWAKLNDLPAAVQTPDIEAFVAYDNAVVRAKRLYPEAIVRPSLEVMRDGLQSAVTLERLPDATKRLAGRLEVTEAQARTEASTRTALYDRAVIEDQSTRYGVNGYVYAGPLDGITRGFCRSCLRLSGLWWPQDLIIRLSNGQMATNPLFSCGGYNCRHFWLPVTEEAIEDRGLKRATLADVQAVNGATGRRKGKK